MTLNCMVMIIVVIVVIGVYFLEFGQSLSSWSAILRSEDESTVFCGNRDFFLGLVRHIDLMGGVKRFLWSNQSPEAQFVNSCLRPHT